MSDTNDKLREECAAWWCEWIQDDDDLGPSMVELNPPELQALVAFARKQRADALMEVRDKAKESAPCSVAALAEVMDAAADGLYHHLRILRKAGLVREVDKDFEVS